MIDINELRPAVEAAGLNAISMQEVLELLDRLEEAESDALEQSRLLGMGASREAALMARLEAAEKSDAESIAMYRKARDERDALRAKIAEMERQKPSIRPAALYPVISWLRNGCDPMKAADELEILTAAPEAKP